MEQGIASCKANNFGKFRFLVFWGQKFQKPSEYEIWHITGTSGNIDVERFPITIKVAGVALFDIVRVTFVSFHSRPPRYEYVYSQQPQNYNRQKRERKESQHFPKRKVDCDRGRNVCGYQPFWDKLQAVASAIFSIDAKVSGHMTFLWLTPNRSSLLCWNWLAPVFCVR